MCSFRSHWMIWSSAREREVDTSADTGFGSQVDRPTMSFDDLPADRQTDACAGILGGCVQSLEDLEHPFKMPGIDPEPIVAKMKLPHLPGCLCRDTNDGRSIPSELDRVLDQIPQQLGKLGRVGVDCRERFDLDVCIVLLDQELQIFDHLS